MTNHATRSLQQNRQLARQSLINKLDILYNGESSVQTQIENIKKEKSLKNRAKAKKKQLLKQKWKEENELD